MRQLAEGYIPTSIRHLEKNAWSSLPAARESLLLYRYRAASGDEIGAQVIMKGTKVDAFYTPIHEELLCQKISDDLIALDVNQNLKVRMHASASAGITTSLIVFNLKDKAVNASRCEAIGTCHARSR